MQHPFKREKLQHWLIATWAFSMLSALLMSGAHYLEIVNHQRDFLVSGSSEAPQDQLQRIAVNIVNNILGTYLPIAAIMLTGFFSATQEYRNQDIGRERAMAAISSFALIQIFNVVVFAIFVYGSRDLEVANMPIIQSAALTSILGIVVTFAFPERKDQALPAQQSAQDPQDTQNLS